MPRKQKKDFKKRRPDQENRRRFCKFTSLGIEEIDYKDIKPFYFYPNQIDIKEQQKIYCKKKLVLEIFLVTV